MPRLLRRFTRPALLADRLKRNCPTNCFIVSARKSKLPSERDRNCDCSADGNALIKVFRTGKRPGRPRELVNRIWNGCCGIDGSDPPGTEAVLVSGFCCLGLVQTADSLSAGRRSFCPRFSSSKAMQDAYIARRRLRSESVLDGIISHSLVTRLRTS